MAKNLELHDRVMESIGTILASDSRIGITELDKEISLLYSVITAIKVRRNSLVPVSKIPDELLSQIFVEYASESSTLFNLKWTKLMLVCRRWHTVGINEQLLWSYIKLTEGHRALDQAAIQLERSGTSPLTIDLHLLSIGVGGGELIQNLQRVRSLKVKGGDQLVPSFLSRLSRFSVPLLESLTIQSHFTKGVPIGFQAQVPDNLLDARAPRLQSLTLRNMSVTWDLLHSLTDLSLDQDYHQGVLPVRIPTMSELLGVLGRSPGLQILYVRHFLPSRWPPDQNHRDLASVELPKLKKATMGGLARECRDLLSYLKIPGTCSFVLLPQGINDGVDARDLLVLIRKQYRSPTARTIRSLEINSSERNIYLAGHVDTKSRDLLESHNHQYIGFNSHPATERDRRSIMTKFVKALPLDAATHLDTRLARMFGEKAWKIPLEMLPSLETITLRVDHATTLHFGGAILELLDRPPSTNKRSWPRLKHIILDGAYLTIGLPKNDVPERVIELLLRVLTRYKDLGAQVDVLELTRNSDYVDDSMPDALAGVVGKFIMEGCLWDPVAVKELRDQIRRDFIDAGRRRGSDRSYVNDFSV